MATKPKSGGSTYYNADGTLKNNTVKESTGVNPFYNPSPAPASTPAIGSPWKPPASTPTPTPAPAQTQTPSWQPPVWNPSPTPATQTQTPTQTPSPAPVVPKSPTAATPAPLNNVQTGADGKTQYTQNAGENANQLLYLKKLYEAPGATDTQKAWAAAQAKQLYGSDTSLANYQSMNAQQMNDYINGLNGGGGGAVSSNQGGFGGAVNNSMEVMQNNGQTQLFDQYNQNVNDYGNAATNQNDPYWDSMRALAESLGSSEYLQKKTSYDALLANLTAQQKADLDALMANKDSDVNTIKDKTFQDWLQARQNLSSRGLSGTGSGFQQDADTRLQMNQQNALGKLFATTQQNIGKTNAQYGEKLANVQQQVSGLNLNNLQQGQFQDMFEGSSKNLLEMAKVYAGLTGKQMPYAQFDSGDLLNSNFNYDKLAQEDRQFVSKLEQDYNLKMTDIMGVDAQGRPTLDTNKFLADIQLRTAEFNEKVSHNRATESISANNGIMRSVADANRLNETIRKNSAAIDAAINKQNASNTNANNTLQLNALKAKLDGAQSQISQYVEIQKAYISKGQAVPPEIQGALKTAQKNYDNVMTGLEVVTGGTKSAAPAGQTSPGMNPDGSTDSYQAYLDRVFGGQ